MITLEILKETHKSYQEAYEELKDKNQDEIYRNLYIEAMSVGICNYIATKQDVNMVYVSEYISDLEKKLYNRKKRKSIHTYFFKTPSEYYHHNTKNCENKMLKAIQKRINFLQDAINYLENISTK